MTKSDALKPRRQLGLFDATMIVMGGIVGAGISANPSEVAHRVHTPFLILGVWVLGGVFAMWARLSGLNWQLVCPEPVANICTCARHIILRLPLYMDGDCFL